MRTSSRILPLTSAAFLLLAGGAIAQTDQPASGGSPQMTPAAPAAPPGVDSTMPNIGKPKAATPPAAPDAAARLAAMGGSPVVGLPVKSADNQSVGTIDNVIVGHDGRVQNLVVSVGGVLGVGAKDVVVSWNDVTIDDGRHEAIAAMSKDELKRAPAFHPPPAGPTNQSMIPLPRSSTTSGTRE